MRQLFTSDAETAQLRLGTVRSNSTLHLGGFGLSLSLLALSRLVYEWVVSVCVRQALLLRGDGGRRAWFLPAGGLRNVSSQLSIHTMPIKLR